MLGKNNVNKTEQVSLGLLRSETIIVIMITFKLNFTFFHKSSKKHFFIVPVKKHKCVIHENFFA